MVLFLASCGEDEPMDCRVAADQCQQGDSLLLCEGASGGCAYEVAGERFYCEGCGGAEQEQCLQRAMKACMG